MRIPLLRDVSGDEAVRCPKDNKLKWIPECRNNCKHFNGYKTLEESNNLRTLLCKYNGN